MVRYLGVHSLGRIVRAEHRALVIATALALVVPWVVLALAHQLGGIVASVLAGQVPWPLVALALVLALVRGVLAGALAKVALEVGHRMATSLRSRLVESAVGAQGTRGEHLATLTQDVAAVQSWIAHRIPTALSDALTFSALAVVAIASAPRASLIGAVAFGSSLIFGLLGMRRVVHLEGRARDAYARLVVAVEDVLAGADVLHHHERAEHARALGRQAFERFEADSLEARRRGMVVSRVVGAGFVATLLVTLTALATEVREGLGEGSALQFILVATLGVRPFSRFLAAVREAPAGWVAARRIEALLSLPPKASALPRRGTWHFPDRGLVLAPGDLVALTGPNGGGKSTLLRHIALADPALGRVVVDAEEVDRRVLAASVLWVPQRPPVFREAIDENVTLGDDRLSARVEGALVDAGVARPTSLLEKAPGEESVPLSLGERHQISLARVLVREAPVLLLDEPTASLDDRAVEVVLTTLSERARAAAIVVVATHDARVVARATRRWHLDAEGLREVAPEGGVR